jgi:hypothetical protein
MAIIPDGLKDKRDFNKSQLSIEDEALENNECPYCDIKLKVNDEGKKACLICERIYG